MTKRILLLTSLDLPTNPRLRKEIELLTNQGHSVDLVGQKLLTAQGDFGNHYASRLDNTHVRYLDCSSDNKVVWLTCSIIHTICIILFSIGYRFPLVSSFAENKFAIYLLFHLRFSSAEYNLVICHTLSAFFAGTTLANKSKCPCVIDIEDYHPGEQTNTKSSVSIDIRRDVLKMALNNASFITFSSPLIKTKCEELCGNPLNGMVVLNTFPGSEFKNEKNYPDKISFVWFSQNIDFGRGLESFLIAADKFSDSIEVHLVGNLRKPFMKEIENRSFVHIHDSMNQQDLHVFLSEHQIGLALEDRSNDLNRGLCLTNKLLAYLQAGQYILFSNTPAQEAFMESKRDNGKSLDLMDSDGIALAIASCINDRLAIERNWGARFENSRELDWDTQSKHWYNSITRLLSDD